jgi:ribosomal subunit interface protein
MNRNVPIAVKNRHGHVSAKMESYAEKKAERLLRFHTRISRIDIVVDGPHEAPELELIVHVDGSANLVAKESNTHFTTAMDQVSEKMERQLIKANQKLKSHKGDTPLSKVDDGNVPIEPEESFDDAMRKKLDS